MTHHEPHIKDEVVRLYREESPSTVRVARVMRAEGVEINQNDVRQILREAGFSNIGGLTGSKEIPIPNLADYGHRASHEHLRDLARELGICEDTLRRRLQKAGYLESGISARARRVIPKEPA